MRTRFRDVFTRDLKNIKDRRILAHVADAIDAVEEAQAPADIPHLKKLRGWKDLFRIRVGDFRVVVLLEEGTVEFLRCLHRKDVYRHLS